MSEEFIREVDEELKEEKLQKLWKKIAPFVISLSLGIVLFTTSIVGWGKYSKNKNQKIGDDFSAAVELIKEKDFDTTLLALDRITEKAHDGYATMAKMKKASILIKEGNFDQGLSIYLNLENNAFDQTFRDMATIMYVFNAIDHKSTDELLNKIERLTKNSEWIFSALELKAFLLLKSGQKKESLKVFQQIMRTNNAPTTLIGRARDMIDHIKGM